LLIGQQLAVAGDLDGAITEYKIALEDSSAQPATKAELHRSTARILMKRLLSGKARRELEQARELDQPLNEYQGLGKTNELLGDLWAPRPRNRPAAQNAYNAAMQNFERAGDPRSARQVKRSIRRLQGAPAGDGDGIFTRGLDKLSRLLLGAIERLRVRAQMKED
jgi:tetratricopeptide (TPR) repeat protein